MSVRKEEIELIRQQEEKLLSSEPRKLWQSIGETESAAPELVAMRGQEFSKLPVDLAQTVEQGMSSMSRRRFLQFSAAASALVTTTACTRRPVDHLVPYVNKPQGLTYGVPFWYASSASNGLGVLVKTREGKPIKLEGNPDHPVSAGGLDATTQASLFDLYSPDRLKTPIDGRLQKAMTWEAALGALTTAIQSAPAGSVRVLTGPLTSPTTKALLDEFLKKAGARHHCAEDVSTDPLMDVVEQLGGVRSLPTFKFDRADVVVSIDADFLGTWLRPVEFTKAFSQRRKLHNTEASPSRLYSFESIHSLTGVAADSKE